MSQNSWILLNFKRQILNSWSMVTPKANSCKSFQRENSLHEFYAQGVLPQGHGLTSVSDRRRWRTVAATLVLSRFTRLFRAVAIYSGTSHQKIKRTIDVLGWSPRRGLRGCLSGFDVLARRRKSAAQLTVNINVSVPNVHIVLGQWSVLLLEYTYGCRIRDTGSS